MSEIQAGMIQKDSNVSKIVDKLHERGWINRKICEQNRRKVNVVITEEGNKIFKKASSEVMAYHKPLMKKLKENEYEALSDMLDRIRQVKGE